MRRFSVGAVAVFALVASACAGTDVSETPTPETPSASAQDLSAVPTLDPVTALAAAPIPGPTATPQPTLIPSPTPGPRPGNDRDSALAIDLDEAVSSSISIFNLGPHFYEVLFEEGTTYSTTVDLSPDPVLTLTVVLADNETEALALAFVGRDLASSLVWTARSSGSHFVLVSGIGSGNYTLTVTEVTVDGSSRRVEAVTPDVSSTPSTSTSPTASPSPGYDRDTALVIDLDETASAPMSELNSGPHFYKVQFEEGAAYVIEVSLDPVLGLIVELADHERDSLAKTVVLGRSDTKLTYTAKVSGFYFVIVNGIGSGNYSLKVTEAAIVGSPAVTETATSDIPSSPVPSPSPSAAPPPPTTPLTFASVTGGFNHTCGVTTDGAAYCWGWNHFGQLGDGMKNNQHHPLPLAVSGGHIFASVSAGFNFTCGITTNGSAYCWGSGGAGQMGDGFRSDQPAPVAVSNGLAFTSISAGNEHTCGVIIDGAAYCWGTDYFGQLGNGSMSQQTTPVAVAGKLAFASISAGTDHTCGITTDRAAYCWGVRGNGQLGSGPKDDFDFDFTQETPVAVLGGLEFVSVSAGAEHTCGVAVDGSAYCWGGVGLGRLGDGFTTGQMEPNDGQDRFRTTPTAVLGELVFATVSAGAEHTCGVTVDGAAHCWGTGFNGALGDGLSADQAKPIAVSGGLVFASVIAGYDHTCGVATNGSAYCWGSPAGLGSGRVPPPEFLKPAAVGPPARE